MLDEEDREPELALDAADRRHEIARLLRVHAGRGLIEEQEPHASGERARDLEAALGAVRKIAREVACARVEIEELQQLERLRDDAVFRDAKARNLRDRAQKRHEVLWMSQPILTLSSTVRFLKSRMFWNVRRNAACGDLIGPEPRDRRALELDLALGGLVHPGEQIENGGFSRAVRPDERRDAPARELEVELRDGFDAAEAHGEVRGLENDISHSRPRPARPWRA